MAEFAAGIAGRKVNLGHDGGLRFAGIKIWAILGVHDVCLTAMMTKNSVGCGFFTIPPCPWIVTWINPQMETWPSGRRRSPAKGVDGKPSRGFESHRLRHHLMAIYALTDCSGILPS